jgi:hypothetical protein
MLTRRLTMAAFAALFAASSSLAMLQQGAQPASARPHDDWRRDAHHQRVDRDDRHVRHGDRDDRHVRRGDRDDRRFRHANYAPGYTNAVYTTRSAYWNNGYYNPAYNNGTYWNGNAVYYANNTNPNWNRRRNDHDRDDRRYNRKHDNGHHNGWTNGNGNRRRLNGDVRKPHIDPWRDHR